MAEQYELLHYHLVFSPGSLITSELLRTMYTHPLQILEGMLHGYSNGIIRGLRLSSQDRTLFVSDGVFCYNGCLYCLQTEHGEGVRFSIPPQEKEYVLFLNPQESEELLISEGRVYPTIQCIPVHLCLLPQNEIESEKLAFLENNSLVICRFSGTPNVPKNMQQLKSDEFDIRKRVYSAYQEPTYMPQVFEILLNLLLAKKYKHPLDYAMILQIQKDGILPVSSMKLYLKEAKVKQYDDLLSAFCGAISNLKFQVSVPSDKPDPSGSNNEQGNDPFILNYME